MCAYFDECIKARSHYSNMAPNHAWHPAALLRLAHSSDANVC